jgi:hypothetical protein
MTVPSGQADAGLGTVERPVRVLFVGGMPRSGSTLLDLMLGQLPGHCDVGELFYMWQAGPVRGQVCACGRPFADCPFWTAVGEAAFGGWQHVDPGRVLALQASIDTTSAELRRRLRLAGGSSSDVAEYLDVVRRLYVAIAQVSGARVVVDSTKRPSTAWLLARDAGVDLRVVHMVRDPRGVVSSWNKQVALPANSGPRDHLKRRSPQQILRRWLSVNLMIGALAGRGVPLLRLRYEDLVRDPAQAMREVLALVEEPVTAEALSFVEDGAITTGRSHAAAGGRVRLERGRLELRADERWRTELSPRLQRLVRTVAGPLMRRYGYR